MEEIEAELRHLTKSDLAENPWEQFSAWYNEALGCDEITYPHAFCLSTLNQEAYPEGRIVLMKSYSDLGLVFYTNTLSVKGKSLKSHPKAGAMFYWDPLGRQVRMFGDVEPVSESEADEYFASRSRESQIGAWASEQSQPIENREALENEVTRITSKYEGQDIPRPPHWSGYRIIVQSFEYWQFGHARLHNRFRYQKVNTTWILERLQP